MNALACLKLIELLYSGVIASFSSVWCWIYPPKSHPHNQELAAPWLLQKVRYMEDSILVNSATFSDGETWFELIGTIGTASGRFFFMQNADGIAKAIGTELCEGK